MSRHGKPHVISRFSSNQTLVETSVALCLPLVDLLKIISVLESHNVTVYTSALLIVVFSFYLICFSDLGEVTALQCVFHCN